MMSSVVQVDLLILICAFLPTTHSVETTASEVKAKAEDTDKTNSGSKAAVPGIIGGTVAFIVLVVGVILIGFLVVRPRWRKWKEGKKKSLPETRMSQSSNLHTAKSDSTTHLEVPQQEHDISFHSRTADETQYEEDETQDSREQSEWYKIKTADDQDIPSVNITENTVTIPHHLQAHDYKSSNFSAIHCKENMDHVTEQKHCRQETSVTLDTPLPDAKKEPWTKNFAPLNPPTSTL